MTNGLRRAAAMVAAIAIGLMLALTATAAASGGDDRDDEKCAEGRAEGDGTTVLPGGVPVNDFVFNVCRTGPATSDVSGFFRAVTVPSGGVQRVSGPVTCAAFERKAVSFLYPLDEQTFPPMPGFSVLIVATDGGPAPADDRVGFFVAPTATFGNDCDFSTPQSQTARNVTSLPLGEGFVKVDSKP